MKKGYLFYTKIKPATLPRPESKTIEVKNKKFFVRVPILRRVGEMIIQETCPDMDPVSKEYFQIVLLSLFRSIREDTLTPLTTWPLEDIVLKVCSYSKKLKEIYPGKKSYISDINILKEFQFFEDLFFYRNLVQNYKWDYDDLDEDVALFIKRREKVKCYNKDYKTSTGFPCACCGMNCNTKLGSFCTYCSEFDYINIFKKFCCFTKLLGSYFLFNWYLPEVARDYILEHWDVYLGMFKKEISFNIIFKYRVLCEEENSKRKKKIKGVLGRKHKKDDEDKIEQLGYLKSNLFSKEIEDKNEIGDKELV